MTHDGYFWEAFRLKRIAKAFLKKTLPEETLERLDLDGLEVEKNDLVDKFFKKTVADVIYRVPIKNTDGHVNFLLSSNINSYTDHLTIFQIWGYLYLICRLVYKAAKDRKNVGAEFLLPPVVAIILHHGRSGFKGETELADLFWQLPGIRTFLPHLRAILFDLNEIDDDDQALNDPETPEFRGVMMVLKCIFRRDVGIKISDVLEETKPFSNDPAM